MHCIREERHLCFGFLWSSSVVRALFIQKCGERLFEVFLAGLLRVPRFLWLEFRSVRVQFVRYQVVVT